MSVEEDLNELQGEYNKLLDVVKSLCNDLIQLQGTVEKLEVANRDLRADVNVLYESNGIQRF